MVPAKKAAEEITSRMVMIHAGANDSWMLITSDGAPYILNGPHIGDGCLLCKKKNDRNRVTTILLLLWKLWIAIIVWKNVGKSIG